VKEALHTLWRWCQSTRLYHRLVVPWAPYVHGTAVGRVRFGSLRRLHPIGEIFGVKRGQSLERCIDRYYIAAFLARHAADIHGDVLEIADDTYTRRFGGPRVQRSG
jgi:hypothetical protein